MSVISAAASSCKRASLASGIMRLSHSQRRIGTEDLGAPYRKAAAGVIGSWPAYHTTERSRRAWCPEASARPERSPLLDNPSDPHPLLSWLMDEALCRILLVSDGGIVALEPRVSGRRAESHEPSSDLAVIVDDLGGRFMACRTHRARLLVIREAQAVADRLRYAPDRSLVRGTTEWREAIARDSRSCRVLARAYGIGETSVRRIKREAGTMGLRGRPTKNRQPLQS